MPTVTFTEEEKARIRYHLGTPQTFPVSDIMLGLPAHGQSAQILDLQMERLPDTAVSLVRMLVGRCDQTEQQMFEAQERLAAKSIERIDLNEDEINKLTQAYRYWVQKLADQFAAPINPYSAAFQAGGGMQINAPRIH